MLHKVLLYGCRPDLCSLFKRYLSSSSNCVRIDNSYLKTFFLISGAPQGSILSALFFLIFVKDVASKVENAEILLFADDIKLFTSVRFLNDCNFMQRIVNRIVQWSSHKTLSLNPSKTNVLSLCRRHEAVCYNYVRK